MERGVRGPVVACLTVAALAAAAASSRPSPLVLHRRGRPSFVSKTAPTILHHGRHLTWADHVPNRTDGELLIATKTAFPFTFRAGSRPDAPADYTTDAAGSEQFSGYSWEIWDRFVFPLATREYGLNYTSYRIVHFNDNTQIINAAAADLVDLSHAALTITPERAQSVDFSAGWFDTGLTIAARTSIGLPLEQALASISQFMVLALTAVGLLIASVLVMAVALFILERSTPGPRPVMRRGCVSGVKDSAVLILLLLLGVGVRMPSGLLSRPAAALCSVSSTAMTIAVTATATVALQSVASFSSVASAADLPGKTILMPRATTAEQYVRDNLAGVTVTSVSNIGTALARFAAGEGDAMVYDKPILTSFVAQDRKEAQSVRFRVVGGVFARQQYGIAVSKAFDRDALAAINQAIIAVYGTDEVAAMRSKWLGELDTGAAADAGSTASSSGSSSTVTDFFTNNFWAIVIVVAVIIGSTLGIGLVAVTCRSGRALYKRGDCTLRGLAHGLQSICTGRHGEESVKGRRRAGKLAHVASNESETFAGGCCYGLCCGAATDARHDGDNHRSDPVPLKPAPALKPSIRRPRRHSESSGHGGARGGSALPAASRVQSTDSAGVGGGSPADLEERTPLGSRQNTTGTADPATMGLGSTVSAAEELTTKRPAVTSTGFPGGPARARAADLPTSSPIPELRSAQAAAGSGQWAIKSHIGLQSPPVSGGLRDIAAAAGAARLTTTQLHVSVTSPAAGDASGEVSSPKVSGTSGTSAGSRHSGASSLDRQRRRLPHRKRRASASAHSGGRGLRPTQSWPAQRRASVAGVSGESDKPPPALLRVAAAVVQAEAQSVRAPSARSISAPASRGSSGSACTRPGTSRADASATLPGLGITADERMHLKRSQWRLRRTGRIAPVLPPNDLLWLIWERVDIVAQQVLLQRAMGRIDVPADLERVHPSVIDAEARFLAGLLKAKGVEHGAAHRAAILAALAGPANDDAATAEEATARTQAQTGRKPRPSAIAAALAQRRKRPVSGSQARFEWAAMTPRSEGGRTPSGGRVAPSFGSPFGTDTERRPSTSAFLDGTGTEHARDATGDVFTMAGGWSPTRAGHQTPLRPPPG